MSSFALVRRSAQGLVSRRLLAASSASARTFSARTTSLSWKPVSVLSYNATTPFPSTTRWFSSNPAAAEDSDGEERYFAELENINHQTLSTLEKQGISTMTEIQALTWDAVSQGKDVLGRSRTGSGKTLAFLLPALERILQEEDGRHHKKGIRILVVSPTRELATQIHKTAEGLVKAHQRAGVSCQVLFGGVSKGGDLQRMDNQLPTILTATPGRLIDHLSSSRLRYMKMEVADAVHNIDVLVLDEMDRLLDMGFREDIQRILSYLPKKEKRQTLLFSATVPSTVKQEIKRHLKRDYDTVDCIQEDDPSSHVVNTVKQSYVTLPPERVITGVVQLIEHLMQQNPDNGKIIVFFNTTAQVAFFANLFRKSNTYKRVLEIHSKLSQDKRSKTNERFRNTKNGILFTSDVSARGVDYPNVTHVVQVGSASDRETYIHRLGRTGRAGKSGEGILVLSEEEVRPLLRQELAGIDIPKSAELQELVEDTNSSDWLPRALGDYEMENKAVDCYKSLIGYYFSRFKQLGIRRPGDTVVEMINRFADEAGLKQRPSISAKIAQQYGVLNHPDLNISRGGGRDFGGSRGGGGSFGGGDFGGFSGFGSSRGGGGGSRGQGGRSGRQSGNDRRGGGGGYGGDSRRGGRSDRQSGNDRRGGGGGYGGYGGDSRRDGRGGGGGRRGGSDHFRSKDGW